MEQLIAFLMRWVWSAATLVLGTAALVLVDRVLRARQANDKGSRIGRQLVMLALTGVLVVVFILTLDIETSQKNQLLALLGLLLSGAIALSSTTFLGNAIAGLMIRAVGDFRPGDFIHVVDQFGRVSERGLLHVEIQSEDRDLVTVPNLQMVSNPVKVVRASGTIVSADVSLGYDLDRVEVERMLLSGAESAGLTDAFVRVMALGDFSVSYRVSGFLKEVDRLISVRSKLHAEVLDALHAGGVEIVSPSFMNQRVLPEGRRFAFDPGLRRRAAEAVPESTPEAIVFDKAESAAVLERLRQRRAALAIELEQLGEGEGEAGAEAARQRLVGEIEAVDAEILAASPAAEEATEKT